MREYWETQTIHENKIEWNNLVEKKFSIGKLQTNPINTHLYYTIYGINTHESMTGLPNIFPQS